MADDAASPELRAALARVAELERELASCKAWNNLNAALPAAPPGACLHRRVGLATAGYYCLDCGKMLAVSSAGMI